MKKQIGMIVGVIALVIIVGGVYSSMSDKKDEVMVKDKVEDISAMVKPTSEAKDNMVKDQVSAPEKSDVMMKGSYEAYSLDKLARAEKGNVVLFFRASWCPTCRSVDADIKANLSKIPENLTILDVNYDSSTELKKKYSVTYQHTFVQVDKDGNLIKKWSGSPTLSAIVSEI